MAAIPTAPVEPVDLRDMDDVDATRRRIFDNVLNAAKSHYPLENDRHRLELSDLSWDGEETAGTEAQKRAIMRQETLSRRLKGTWQLVDKASGQVLDRKPTVIAHVPYLTQRGTMISNGSEYAVPGQMRLRSGVYTRRKDSGELEAHFNLLPGKGKAFRVSMEPSTGVMKMHVGQGSVPLYPVLRAQGMTDEQMESAWGREIFAANKDQRDVGVLSKLRERFVGRSKTEDDEDDAVALSSYFARMQMDEDVVRRSLGKYVSPPPLVKAAERSKRPQVALVPFDRAFFDTIPNTQRVHPPDESNNMIQYRTVMADGEKAGVIGVLLTRNDSGLLQDVLVPEWQGRGVLRPALRLICKELKLKKVLATVKKTNLRSRSAHEGIGFRLFTDEAMKGMRRSKWLPEDSVRYWLNVPADWRKT